MAKIENCFLIAQKSSKINQIYKAIEERTIKAERHCRN